MTGRLHIALLVVVAIVAPRPSAALTVYKWRGPDGEITYALRSPPDVQAKQFEIHEIRPPPPKEDAPTLREQLLKERAERIEENCTIATENVRILKTFDGIEDVDQDTGETRVLDEEAIRARYRAAQRNVDEYCTR